MNTNAFVPLSAPSAVAASSAPGTPAKTAGDAGAVKVFRPTHDGAAAVTSTPHIPGEPKVTLEREGDLVKCIRIQCACGHTLELDCAY